MRKNRIVCCDFCGRDTTNKCRICQDCFSGCERHSAPKEMTTNDIRTILEVHGAYGSTRNTDVDTETQIAMNHAIGM